MNYDDKSKKQLIEMLKELEGKRAFTYEDRMKLAILDSSPFTVWASDRNCIITLWEGQCEAIYNHSKKEAIGKDYVDLIVHSDEKIQARIDQLSIIDNDVKFHNLANDHGKNGNTFTLITNCFRIKDPNTGEYWNAEMGLIIDYLKEEQDRLRAIVEESRKVMSFIVQFDFETHQRIEQFQSRKSSLKIEIAKGQQKAAVRRIQFKELVAPIKGKMEEINDNLDRLIGSYLEKIRKCGTFDDCAKIRRCFVDECDDLLFEFEEIIADFGEINEQFSGDNTIMQLKEAIFINIKTKSEQLSHRAYGLLEDATTEVDDYKVLLGSDQSSPKLDARIGLRDSIKAIKEAIDDYFNAIILKVSGARDSMTLDQISSDISIKTRNFELKLEEKKAVLEDL